MRRLFLDATFTRTQTSNVGITRTVKRLFREFEALAPARGMTCVPLAYHTKGFRVLPPEWAEPAPVAPAVVSSRTTAQRVMHWITEGPIRTLVSGYFPLVLRLPLWLIYSWWDFNRLSRDLPPADFRPGDVLFLSDASWNYSVWNAVRAARRRGASVFTVIYDLIPLRQPQYVPRLTSIAFSKWLRRMLPLSDGVLCISRAVEDDVRALVAEKRWAAPSITHFRLGCDPISSTASDASVRPELRDLFVGAPCFAAIGSIEPRKNYGFVLDTFESLWNEGIQARLLIVGRRTPQCADLLERMEAHPELGRRFHVVFDGTDAEVGFVYANSRALLFASLAEGFGLPLVEARAHGCPVIASDLPAFAELADAGVQIFPADSAQALRALVLAHLDQRPAVGRMQPFTWTDSATRCLEFIAHVGGPRPSAAPPTRT
jgi:glycosyltransferase involved in cell wall biosynthesis